MSGQREVVVDIRDAFCLYPTPVGAVAALRGLTLSVGAGQRVVVHGPNGSGKSTLIGVLSGRRPLSAGTAMVAGHDLAGSNRAASWRTRAMGWVDQDAARNLRPELSVMDNVTLQQEIAGIRRARAVKVAAEWLERLGVGGLRDRRPGTLSGGEVQRVAVCAALAHGPRLVLADEPTGELDGVSATIVYQALIEACDQSGAALILVSHDRSAAIAGHRVVRIRDGRISETWPADAPNDERLVADDRGWVRVPAAMRPRTAFGQVWRAGSAPSGDVVLSPVTDAAPTDPAPAIDPAPAPDGSRAVASWLRPRGSLVGDRVGEAVLDGVHKRYGDRVVLAGLDLVITSGRLTVLQGRSGVGKSTALRLLVGLERPDSGRVTVAGTDLGALSRDDLARLRGRIAAVATQDVHLVDTMDAKANLHLARSARGMARAEDVVAAALESVGAAHLTGRRVALLSGGERQRVALARVLAVRPLLAVLDEPTSQLDEASVELVAEVLRALASAGAAVVAASHDPVVVAAADQVVDLGDRLGGNDSSPHH